MSQMFNNLKKNLVTLFSAVTISLTSSTCNRKHHLQGQTIRQRRGLNLGVVRFPHCRRYSSRRWWALNIVQVVCTEGERWTLQPQRTQLILRSENARATGPEALSLVLNSIPINFWTHRGKQNRTIIPSILVTLIHKLMLQLPGHFGDQNDRKKPFL